MTNLSWDLHVHPGEPSDHRWGDAYAVRAAARRAGVHGFVWKSHDAPIHHSVALMSHGPPSVIPSITLNHWVNPETLVEAVNAGIRWVWAPSRGVHGSLAWDLPLPPWWLEAASILEKVAGPMVIATSHLSGKPRLELAEFAVRRPGTVCSVTHSLYLDPAEVRLLAQLGCVFEFDLYTWTVPQVGRPRRDLLEQVDLVLGAGAVPYLTSDAGQVTTGDPYEFAAKCLEELNRLAGSDLVLTLCQRNPERVVSALVPGPGWVASH